VWVWVCVRERERESECVRDLHAALAPRVAVGGRVDEAGGVELVPVACGVWCVVCGVWCVVCGVRRAVWCVVCGVWCVVCGVGCTSARTLAHPRT